MFDDIDWGFALTFVSGLSIISVSLIRLFWIDRLRTLHFTVENTDEETLQRLMRDAERLMYLAQHPDQITDEDRERFDIGRSVDH